ncbi:MAG: hypothetical protein ACLQA5_19130 [Solirubrobacteraceae bacterium]
MRARIAGFVYVALFPPAAFAVHQLRYWLAYGSNAGLELQRTGHSYLHSVVPWLVLLLALAVGGFLRALGRAFAAQTSRARFTLSLTAMWLTCSAALIAIFACQEFLEGLFATGHPGGLVGVFGYGGWWSIPAALSIGLVLATLLHGARGSCARSPTGERDLISLLSDRCCVWRVPAMRWSCVRRRWSGAGRVGVRRRSVETRRSLGCEPVADSASSEIAGPRALLRSLNDGFRGGPCYR